jgi:hypothetical protein
VDRKEKTWIPEEHYNEEAVHHIEDPAVVNKVGECGT